MSYLRRICFAAAALLAVAALAAGCGDDDGEDEGGPTATPAVTGNEVDRAFAMEMIEHHQLAIDMARLAQQNGESEFVRQLADDIVATQTEEIHAMKDVDAKLAADNVPAGELELPDHLRGMEHDLATLKKPDAPFDRSFIDMMVPHHQGAIRMAREELGRGQNDELLELADAIIAAQSAEIEEMNAHREEVFGAPAPAGGVPGEDGGTESTPGGEEHNMEGMEH